MPLRRITRRPLRSHVRRLNRPSSRFRWRAPDDLREALVAFRRAIRCHRRLARLAPRFFDSVVVTNERIQDEHDRQWQALWEPCLAKVYGTTPEPAAPSAPLPPLPHPNTRRAVERQLAELQDWLSAGRTALDLYHRRRPHDLPDLPRIAALLRIAVAFKELACGIDPNRPPPAPHDEAAFLADLERAYPSDPAPIPGSAAGLTLPDLP